MVDTRLHTIEDLEARSSRGERYELIEGELVEVSPGRRLHAVIQLRIGSRLLAFVDEHDLGIVGTEEGFILQSNPDTVLAPDVSFVSRARLTPESPGWSRVPPDLAVEVVSPSNSQPEIDRKVCIYLSGGVKVVWIVYPERKSIVIHEPEKSPQILSGDQSLEGGTVLPGFALPLSLLFGE